MNERVKGPIGPYATTTDIPVYHPEKMSTEELMKAVLNAGAASNNKETEQNGTK